MPGPVDDGSPVLGLEDEAGTWVQIEELLRSLLDAPTEGILGIDGDGLCTFCNFSAAELLGYRDPCDLIGQRLHALSHHARRDGTPNPASECRICRVPSDGSPVYADDEIFWCRDHTSIPVECSTTPIHRDGIVVGARLTFTDLTRRNQTMGDLQRQKALLEAIIRDIPDAVVLANPQREIFLCNPAVTKLFGYRPDQLLGRKTAVLYASGDEFERQGKIRFHPGANEMLKPYVVTYRRRDGSEFPGETVGTIIQARDGNPVGFMGLIRDVTERRQAEEALRESEQRFRDFTAAAADYFWEMDESLRFSYFSDRMAEVTGVKKEELLGRTRQETGIPNLDEDTWSAHLADLEAHRPFRNFIHPRTRPDGEVVWLSINGIPTFDDAGRFQGYRGTGADISKTHRLSEELSYQAKHDPLTGLINRREFEARLARVLDTATSEPSEHALCYLNSLRCIGDTFTMMPVVSRPAPPGKVVRYRGIAARQPQATRCFDAGGYA